MVGFGVSSVSNLTLCSKSDFGYPKLNLGYDYISDLGIPNRKFRFGKYEIEIPIWEYPKSYSEHKHVCMAYRVIQKVDAKLSSNLMIFIMQLDSFYQAT